jgi:hypothetical protein
MGEARRKAVAIQTGTVAGCGNCRFYLADPGHTDGACRRMPPVPVMIGMRKGANGPEPTIGTCWPETQRTQWCGEHEPVAAVGQTVDFSAMDLTEGSA